VKAETQNARTAARFLSGKWTIENYAACLCIVPDADAVPRIALTERSIAAHSLAIS
jgi:hypothetical protein